MAKIRSFPNNQDEYIGAEEVMRWLHGRSSGVFGADGNASVSPVLDTMAVEVSDGNGWLANAKGNGIVWWVDSEEKNGQKLQLAVDIADAVLPRIDRVVVSWQTTNYVALPEVVILKGTPASNPIAPELTNDSTVRQISLAAIVIPAGTTAITGVMITDERLNPEVCGIVSEHMTADTSMVNAQYLAAVEELRTAIKQAWDGEIPDGSITQEMLDPNIKLGSNDVYIGPEEPTGEDRPKLWINPEDERQEFGIQSAEYPGCYYRIIGGVVEWINPPMNLGVSYLTTERYNGKPVYITVAKLSLSASGQKYVGIDYPVTSVVSIDGIVKTADLVSLPIAGYGDGFKVLANGNFITNVTVEGGTAYPVVKYTK